MNLRNKGKKRFIKKIKKVRNLLEEEKITVNDVKKSIAGNIGYIQIANVDNLVKKYLYLEKENSGK